MWYAVGGAAPVSELSSTLGMAGFTHVNVSEMVKEKNLHSGKHDDEELDTFVLDEDLVW